MIVAWQKAKQMFGRIMSKQELTPVPTDTHKAPEILTGAHTRAVPREFLSYRRATRARPRASMQRASRRRNRGQMKCKKG